MKNRVIDLYKALEENETLFPTDTHYTFWDQTYSVLGPAKFDREFVRKYAEFWIYDFAEAEDIDTAKANFKLDVYSILSCNERKYAQMYRVLTLSDNDDPITYNYDLTETTGKQKQTNTKGQQQNTIGSHTDTIGTQTNTHSVAPYNDSTFAPESQDIAAERQDTIGSHTDTEGSRTDTIENDEWTLTRRGNIGVQTAGDMLRIHTEYWTKYYKFWSMIFEDIRQQLLLVGDC